MYSRLFVKSLDELKEKINVLSKQSEKAGLTINKQKTKALSKKIGQKGIINRRE